MPLIDLSSPTNNAAAVSMGNDLSGLGGLQNMPGSPTVVNATVANGPTETNATTNISEHKNVLPDLNSLSPLNTSVPAPKVEQVKAENKTVEIKQEIPVVNEEHIMMRNVPKENAEQPTSVTNGIKEFKGPEFGNNQLPVKNVVNTLPPLNQMPTIMPVAPVQTENKLEVENKPPVVNKVEIPVVQPPAAEANLVKEISANLDTIDNPALIIKAPEVVVPTPPVVVSQPIMPIESVKPVVNTVVEKVAVVEVPNAINSIDEILAILVNKGSSDLHIAVGFPPTMRIDGKLVAIGNKDLTAEEAKDLLMPLLDKRLQDEMLKYMDVDFSYTHKATGTRFRVNVFWSKATMAAAFRLITSKIKTISELNLPNICYDLIKKPHGLILLTGPTGSGKSTSIAAMIQEINMTEAKHIVTIEDPVEYIFPRALSIVNQREIGGDASSWQRALRELLRQDPNIVVVGEMRDHETIASTITVAETGHLVFATLHTNSASQTMDRIIDVFPDAQQPQIRAQLATVITAVISQRLVPIKSGGRKAIFEVMLANPAVKNAIREGKTYQVDNIIQTNADQGMITLEKSLVGLIRNGEISVEQALEFTTKPDELQSLLQGN